jgi:hypothetical protein
MKIAFVGAQDKPHELACTHWSGIKAAAKRIPPELRVFCCRSGNGYVNDIIAWKPDVIVYNLIDMVHDKIGDARKLRDALKDARIVFWYTDCRTPETGQIDTNIRGLVDLFITSSDDPHGFHEAHFGMKPEWVPQAAEPTDKPEFYQKAVDMYGDFIFIGGKYPRGGFLKRFNIIRTLEQNHKLHVIDGNTAETRAKVYNLMPTIYGSARFSLDISHFWDIPRYTSNRFWVIPAFWGFGLTKRFPRHEELVPETHHVYWDTVDELLDKMKYYGEHEEERKKMIVKGWEYAKEHHTYEHRIHRILELLGVL